MSDEATDKLWPHFAPLWKDLQRIAPDLLLVGGYGLFLKQQWLLSQLSFLGPETGDTTATQREEELVVNEVRTVVPIERWKNQTPRVTKDFDILASLDVIASSEQQRQFHDALIEHGFVFKIKLWQFEKKIGEDQSVILEFHAPSPKEKRDDLRLEGKRVKPKPSLGEFGIHGRENAEAAGSEFHPFSFIHSGVEILLPNPVTLTLMKLIATRERHQRSENASSLAENRPKERRQAQKHAEDVCRVVAMMTLEERDSADFILASVRDTQVFKDAQSTFSEYFQTNESWGSQAVIDKWENNDFDVIRETLAAWYG